MSDPKYDRVAEAAFEIARAIDSMGTFSDAETGRSISDTDEFSLVKTMANCTEVIEAALLRVSDGLFAIAEAVEKR